MWSEEGILCFLFASKAAAAPQVDPFTIKAGQIEKEAQTGDHPFMVATDNNWMPLFIVLIIDVCGVF